MCGVVVGIEVRRMCTSKPNGEVRGISADRIQSLGGVPPVSMLSAFKFQRWLQVPQRCLVQRCLVLSTVSVCLLVLRGHDRVKVVAPCCCSATAARVFCLLCVYIYIYFFLLGQ